ncbi:autophagy-related protein 13-domain-containing protein [Lentinula detonsa]|uniref:Autophagy-related protein 13 n=1 Tax=Lentinula detonsa TaxID=2804962 RepID=A0AA38Q7T4_9AGAR|nr:autophagy-related protein 13-domain-containing protein [Lentinula detonsa]
MSHDAQKADQITFHFYTKLFYILNDARATAPAEIASVKTDKWFNLETPDSDLWTKEGREPYKTTSAPRLLPPLEIQVLLTIPDSLTNNQVLVYISPDSTRVAIQPTYKYVLLERWTLDLNMKDIHSSFSDSESSSEGSGSVSPATLYKHGIPLFRSLYSLLRVLPAWKLSKRFKTRRLNGTGALGVQVRVRGDPGSGLDESIVMRFDSPSALPTSTHTFPPIQHPMGTLNLTTTYITSPNFKIDDMESLLSLRFISMDTGGTKGMEFTPTLVKNQQRDSLLSSAGGSLSTRSRLTSLPRSPPRDILRRPGDPSQLYSHSRTPSDADSIAERFIIPSRTASNPSNPPITSSNPPPIATHNLILPITRAKTTTSTSTQPLSDIAARLRKESISHRNTVSDTYLPLSTIAGTSTQPFPSSSSPATSISGFTGGTGTSAPSTSLSSSPMAMRRPGLNPFKSNTLAGVGNATSASGSPRLTSGLSGIAGSGLALGSVAVSSSPLGANSTGLTSLSSLSNLSNLPRRPSSPSSLSRPSPPSFTPSSIGAASTSTGSGSVATGTAGGTTTVTATTVAPAGTGTEEIAVPPRKRYSSSFGHRYSSSPARGGAAMSVGSQGSQGGSGIVESAGTGGGGAIGSLGQASVRSGMSGMSGMSFRSRRSGGSGSVGGDGRSGSASGTQDPAPPSTYPDFHDPLDGQDVFTHDDHDDISTFMQDIDSRKPLIGRSRIYANANAQPSQLSRSSTNETEPNDEAESDDERQRTIRARPRNNSKDRASFGQTLTSSPLSREADLPRASPAHRGTGSPLISPRSGVAVTPPSSRRASYTGLSPPSSPLRNPIPLIEEDDDDQRRSSKPSSRLSTTVATPSLSPQNPVSTARVTSNATLGVEGTPSSPPSHTSPMLTTASDVEARLKKMNDVFLASLEGLGGRSGKGRIGKGKELEGS